MQVAHPGLAGDINPQAPSGVIPRVQSRENLEQGWEWPQNKRKQDHDGKDLRSVVKILFKH